MFYAHLPPIRIARLGVLAAAVFGLLTACGVNPPQAQSGTAQTPSTVTARSVDQRRIALNPIGSGRSAAVGDGAKQ